MNTFKRLILLLLLNCTSYLTGVLARIAFPKKMQVQLNRLFCKVFGIDMSNAVQPIESFQSLESLFIREIKLDSRPISGTVCSPADGILSISKSSEGDTAIQAKGLHYSLNELCLGQGRNENIDFEWFFTVYLAPHNYHRVHTPVAGEIVSIRYFTGQLWPVNKPFVKYMPLLFTRNERLVFEIKNSSGRAFVAMVGALNVGRIITDFLPGFASNSTSILRSPLGSEVFEIDPPESIAIGQELGTFMLGSTVVVGFERGFLDGKSLLSTENASPVEMGQALNKSEE